MDIFNKRLYLTRHGEVDFNRQGIMVGSTDVPLNKFGRKQAKTLADLVRKTYSIDRLITSDLKRAVETANEISKAIGVEVETDSTMRERDYGSIEGRTKSDLKKMYPDYKTQSGAFVGEYDFPEAEPINDFCKRAIKGIKKILRKYPDENIMIVTHAGIIRAVYSYVYKVPIAKVREVYRPERTNCIIENY